MREQFRDYGKKIQEKTEREAEEIKKALEADQEAGNVTAGQSLDDKVKKAISRLTEVDEKCSRRR